MIYDFHTHTFLSDGENSPIELVRFAVVFGYRCIALTDHGSYSNLDFIISRLKKDCQLAEKYWDINAIPGVELTNVPSKSIDDMAKAAKELGARIVVAHGESIVGAPSKTYKFLLVKVQPGQRLPTSPAPNLTFREVTS